MILWWSTLSVTIRTGTIILLLIYFLPFSVAGIIRKFQAEIWGITVLTFVIIMIIGSQVVNSQNRGHSWTERVIAYEQALNFNQNGLCSRMENRQVSRSFARNWSPLGNGLTVIVQPNYRFTEEQLVEFGRIAYSNENLYEDTHWLSESIWMQYALDNYWLRTYFTEDNSLTFTWRAGLSTIYGVEENIAVIEVRFPNKISPDVLRLPLINQYGELYGENFELALQLQQLILSERIEDVEEVRPFERAREVIYELSYGVR